MPLSLRDTKVSVVIRVRDIEKYFHYLLAELSRQTLKPSEIIVVDNFSSEKELKNLNETLSHAKRRHFKDRVNFRLVPMSDYEFSHPYSTNLGVNAASNELVCIINGHSIPISTSWLSDGLRYFSVSGVAGVSGYFVPHKDGSLWEKFAYGLAWARFSEVGKMYSKDKYFSTINCIIRKSLWMAYPFDENLPDVVPETKVYGGEDYDWAREMVARGYRIVVDPKFNVFHSHGLELMEIVRKYFVWKNIRRKIDSFKRPRKSYTRLNITFS